MGRQKPDATQEPTPTPNGALADSRHPDGESCETAAMQVSAERGEFPSKRHQFKPGQSGNPLGRPKGTGLTDRLRTILARDDGRAAQALVEVAVREALKGDFRFWDRIYDRMDGPVKQQIEASLVMFAKAINRDDFDGA